MIKFMVRKYKIIDNIILNKAKTKQEYRVSMHVLVYITYTLQLYTYTWYVCIYISRQSLRFVYLQVWNRIYFRIRIFHASKSSFNNTRGFPKPEISIIMQRVHLLHIYYTYMYRETHTQQSIHPSSHCIQLKSKPAPRFSTSIHHLDIQLVRFVCNTLRK